MTSKVDLKVELWSSQSFCTLYKSRVSHALMVNISALPNLNEENTYFHSHLESGSIFTCNTARVDSLYF